MLLFPQMVECGDGEIGKTRGGSAVLVLLKAVAAIFSRGAAPARIEVNIVGSSDGDKIPGQAEREVAVADAIHLAQDTIHELSCEVTIDQPVAHRDPIHKAKVVVMQ